MNLAKMRRANQRRTRPPRPVICRAPGGQSTQFYEEFHAALAAANDARALRHDPRWDVEVVTNGLGVELAIFRTERQR